MRKQDEKKIKQKGKHLSSYCISVTSLPSKLLLKGKCRDGPSRLIKPHSAMWDPSTELRWNSSPRDVTWGAAQANAPSAKSPHVSQLSSVLWLESIYWMETRSGKPALLPEFTTSLKQGNAEPKNRYTEVWNTCSQPAARCNCVWGQRKGHVHANTFVSSLSASTYLEFCIYI